MKNPAFTEADLTDDLLKLRLDEALGRLCPKVSPEKRSKMAVGAVRICKSLNKVASHK